MFQLVLNGNNVPWSTIVSLTNKLTKLDELHVSANNLGNPGNLVIEVIIIIAFLFRMHFTYFSI